MAVVVGAPYVYRSVEASREFVAVVGDIGGEICGIAVLTDKHFVFQTEFFDIRGRFAFFQKSFVENFGVLIPERAVLFISEISAFQNIDNLIDFTVFVQNALVEPGVVFNAVFREIFFHRLDVFRQGEIDKSLSALAFGL